MGITALFGGRAGNVLLTGALAGYALWVTFDQGLKRPTQQQIQRGESVAQAVRVTLSRNLNRLGAYIVHFGVIITFAAIAISSSYQTSQQATLAPGDSLAIGKYKLDFLQASVEQHDHRSEQKAVIRMTVRGNEIGNLEPGLNHYATSMEPIGTPAVRTTLSHDLYLTLMNVGSDGTIGLRAILTPAVAWIWIGVFIMVLGTGFCLLPQRPTTQLGQAKLADDGNLA